MKILSIETSCDETAVAISEIEKEKIKILANIVSSQIKLHAKWGGVVPNLAAREHVKNSIPILDRSFKLAKIRPKDIDLIAVTQGPGLIPALLVGTSLAKTLSFVWKKPLLGIHHIEGHIYANFISESQKSLVSIHGDNRSSTQGGKVKNQIQTSIKFPVLCLVVSGGHTQLILMKKHLQYEIIGQTQDDAAGEAFDKVARILDLSYPGGPVISEQAEKYLKKTNQQLMVSLPRPMINSKDFNFSFSGLKTAVLYETKKNHTKLKDKKYIQALSFEFQQAVIDVLIKKTVSAAKKYKPKTIMLAGGVSANRELRKQLGEAIKNDLSNTKYCIPNTKYSLDNAAMIGAAAFYRFQKEKIKKNFNKNWRTLQANANLKME